MLHYYLQGFLTIANTQSASFDTSYDLRETSNFASWTAMDLTKNWDFMNRGRGKLILRDNSLSNMVIISISYKQGKWNSGNGLICPITHSYKSQNQNQVHVFQPYKTTLKYNSGLEKPWENWHTYILFVGV